MLKHFKGKAVVAWVMTSSNEDLKLGCMKFFDKLNLKIFNDEEEREESEEEK